MKKKYYIIKPKFTILSIFIELIMTKIFVINNPDLPSIENVENVGARKSRHNVCEKNQVQDLNKHKEDASLETERNLHIAQSLKRQEKFELIIENGQTEY